MRFSATVQRNTTCCRNRFFTDAACASLSARGDTFSAARQEPREYAASRMGTPIVRGERRGLHARVRFQIDGMPAVMPGATTFKPLARGKTMKATLIATIA